MAALNEDPVWMETERTTDGFVTRLRFSWPRHNGRVLSVTRETALPFMAEHNDARWERVVRRWEQKHVGL